MKRNRNFVQNENECINFVEPESNKKPITPQPSKNPNIVEKRQKWAYDLFLKKHNEIKGKLKIKDK